MSENKEYQQAITQAKENLTDLKERGASAIGGDVLEFMDTLLTPEEIAESDLRVAIIGEIIKARQEKGISQKKLEELSGVKQPIIARMEKGTTSPQIDTILKVLIPLGKTLAVVPLETKGFSEQLKMNKESMAMAKATSIQNTAARSVTFKTVVVDTGSVCVR